MPPLATIVQPPYAAPCVPPGHEVVSMVNGPPAVVMLTCAVAVDEPEALVAVNVYVVVAVGLTVVEPLADADVNVPGVMAIVVAPDVTQLSVLLDPELMPAGLAVKELITGFPDVLTLTTAVAVTEPVEFVAVSV